jgi:hypothetical protein
MKTLIVTLIFSALAFSQQQQSAQDSAGQQTSGQRNRKGGEARRASLRKLQTDLDQAAARAKFTEEQRRQFDDARATLRQAAEDRMGGRRGSESAGQSDAREALRTLRDLVQSDAFQAEDREILRKDLRELRTSGARNRRAVRRPAA